MRAQGSTTHRGRIGDVTAMLLAVLLLTGAESKGCGGDAASAADADAGDSIPVMARDGATAADGNCTLEPSAYDPSCQDDSDCVAAFLGNVCTDVCVGDCPNAAIRRTESARYERDLAATPARIARPNGGTCSCAPSSAICLGGLCSLRSPLDDTGTGAAAGQCRWPGSLNDAGPGVRGCTVGRAFLKCTFPSGVGCHGVSSTGPLGELCISNDPTHCSDCSSLPSGATCRNQCPPGEYAVSCGGPPLLEPDGGVTAVYQAAPDGCTPMGVTPAGNAYSCCPCL
jgi:hypothetical protein